MTDFQYVSGIILFFWKCHSIESSRKIKKSESFTQDGEEEERP